MGRLEVFCVPCKLCLFCMLSRKDMSQCQLFIRAAVFMYHDAWQTGVHINWPMLLFILDLTKGKRLPYSGNIPNAQAPKGVIFIYFYLCNYVRYAVLSGSKVSLRATFSLVGKIPVLMGSLSVRMCAVGFWRSVAWWSGLWSLR